MKLSKPIVLGLALHFLSSPSYACTVVETTAVEKFDRATHVLFVRIVSTRLISTNSEVTPEKIEAKVEIINSYKGSSEINTVITDFFEPVNCAITLSTGNKFLIFLNENNHVLNGTRIIFNEEINPEKEIIDEISALSESDN